MRVFKTFSARLSFYVILMTTLIFVATFMLFFSYSKNIVKDNAVKNAGNILSNTNSEICTVLEQVEIIVDNMSWIVSENIDTPDSIYRVVRQIVDNNPVITGAAVAFSPNHYKKKGWYFSPYAYRDSVGIHTTQLGNDDYNYFAMEWYNIPYKTHKPHWSEPYFDEGGANVMMTTYSKPLFDKDGKVYAVITSDLSLDWLNTKIGNIQPYDNSYNVLIGRLGTYIVHPNKVKVLNETVFSNPSITSDTVASYIGLEMIQGHRGMQKILLDSIESYVFYAPIEKVGWSMGVVCRVDEVFEGLSNIKSAVIIVVVLGSLLLLVFCYNLIYNMTTPLRQMNVSARSIAKGDFSIVLPETTTNDEIGGLRNAFEYMKQSLVEHIAELKDTTSARERIESELRIARDIQMGMIPKIFPPFPERDDIDIYARLTPAKEVGGDLYDFFIAENKLCFAIGDVSGKGIPASLFMAVSRSLFRSIASHFDSPSQILSSMNSSISETNDSNMFITMFIGVLDLGSGRLTYCNAGHNPPVVVNGGKAEFMNVKPNIPVGLFDGFNYVDESVIISKGDTLFLYTDGVTEAEDIDENLYGEDRMIEALSNVGNISAKKLLEKVIDSVDEHVKDAARSDDMTILTVKLRKMMNRSIVIKNEISELVNLAQFIEEIGEELSLEPKLVMNLNLVMEEAVSNIILYAYPKKMGQEITINAERRNNMLIFTITDTGVEFDPTRVEEADITLAADERPIGGLGIFLIKKIMNEVEYQRIDGANVFTLKKELN